jgi:AraC-like DNA-binding protein
MPTPLAPAPFAFHMDVLMTALEVNFVKLSECQVSPGWRLLIAPTNAPALHYNLRGLGRMTIGASAPFQLAPHTLVIAPPGRPFSVEASSEDGRYGHRGTIDSQKMDLDNNQVRRLVAGDAEHGIVLICGYFRASYGVFVDLFSTLPAPIVEAFEAADGLDGKLKAALSELASREIGSAAMSAALLKQVLVSAIRRSLISDDLWFERVASLRDQQIARSYSEMVARPGAHHSIVSLARIAGLSRSAFMARFAHAFDSSPMAVLRELRMRYAAGLLRAEALTVDKISKIAGYSSRGSFVRAFKRAYGDDPSDYRAEVRKPAARGD